MKLVYSDRYLVDIGAHVFPTKKYKLVRDGALTAGLAAPADVLEPIESPWEELALVHDADYLEKTRTGGFRPSEMALLELPWTAEAAEGFRVIVGGTVLAARLAVDEAHRMKRRNPEAAAGGTLPLAVSANLGGGFHHAFPSHGEGFCLYNDVGVAVRALQRDGTIKRAAIIDCDVHQGNGTAFIFDGDPSVFTFSIHQEHNYPYLKPRGTRDVGLTDGADDAEYVEMLRRSLPEVFAFQPDLLVYVAGADPYQDDMLGGLNITFEGLAERDEVVLGAARDAKVPVVIVLAGGYARRVDDTVAIHLATLRVAKDLAGA